MAKTPEELYVELCKAQLAGFPRDARPEFYPHDYGVLNGSIFAPSGVSDGDEDDKDERIYDALSRLNIVLDDLAARTDAPLRGSIFVDDDEPAGPPAPKD